MACPKAWPVAALCLSSLCVLVRTARAGSELASSADEAKPVLARLEVALIGDVGQDPVLFERIRSLFPPQTAVVLRDDERIDQQSVLAPQRAGTVYLWIRVTERTNARVYLALSEEPGRARYLFRELKLDAGLDEVGGETLAEVAHSSAQALWLRELQTPRQALVAALQREAEPPQAPRAPSAPSAASSTRDTSERATVARAVAPGASVLRLALGASETAHASGAEGWLHEPGAFLAVEYRARLSVRVAVRYLVPSDFELAPTQVHLSGASGELRAGWLSNDARHLRVRLEVGLGVLLGHARASIALDQPKAHALAEQDFQRAYSLGAAFFEWPLGPAWIAAGVDLRVPLQRTSYEVGGQPGASVSPSLCPGGSLEVGFGFDPVVR